MTVGTLGAGKDEDAFIHTADGIGGSQAVLERVQGSEIGQCECSLCHSGVADDLDLLERDFLSFFNIIKWQVKFNPVA